VHRIDETTELASSLRTFLLRVPLAGLSTSVATRQLTRHVAMWAGRQGWVVQLEARSRASRLTATGNRVQGYLDVKCSRGNQRPAVCIEIDRAGKLWSLTKLLAEVDAGDIGLWVRWRGRTEFAVPASIGFVAVHEGLEPRPDLVAG
jgi:hypothetical protein